MSFVEMPTGSDTVENTPTVAEAQSSALEDKVGDVDRREIEGLVSYVYERFKESKDKRRTDEERWITCFRNFRGVYGPDTQFTSTEKSKAFIKITKTKVLAGHAQITDVLFAGNKFPIGIQPPNNPISVDGAVHFDPNPQAESLRSNPAMSPQMAKIFGPKKGLLQKIGDKLKAGIGLNPTDQTWEPAKEAANKMEKQIHDQLNEAESSKSLRSLVYELCLFGTGVYKGPFLTTKEYAAWDADGTYTPTFKNIPDMGFVSIWNSYPDADARNMSEAEWFIERHRLSQTQLRALKKRPNFRKKNIDKVIEGGPNYNPEWWESNLTEDGDATTNFRYEVLEFWGTVDKETLREAGLKIPAEFKDYEELQINAWVSGDLVIRLLINPFKPARIPYHAVPYEINPYSFFGIGIAENMLDSQLLMNGFMRMAVDNAALSGNIIFEVNEDMLVPGQSMEIYPGKVFRRMGGAPGQAFFSNKIENVTQECIALFDKARQLSDEQTGMPSYAHGMTDVMSTGKTAAGMSMIMSAAAQNIKAVVRNIDDFLLAPLGRDLFSFNMQFNFDKDFIGDCTVVAKGTESLMRNEIRSQRLMQFAQFAAGNQSMLPLVKWDYILREFSASLDLDEDLVVNDPRAAAIQAVEMAKLQATMAPPPTGQGAQQAQQQQAQANGAVEGASVPAPEDPTGNGNGNIAPGAAPPPGNPGFSGNQ